MCPDPDEDTRSAAMQRVADAIDVLVANDLIPTRILMSIRQFNELRSEGKIYYNEKSLYLIIGPYTPDITVTSSNPQTPFCTAYSE